MKIPTLAAPPASARVSRRALAHGAAWAIPTVAVAAAAPAFAASTGPTVTGTICRLFYGGGTINQQTHSIFLGITTSTGVIPKGTSLTWTVCVTGGGSGTGGTNEVPTTNYSQNGSWTLTLSQTSGNPLSPTCFTATITFLADYTTGAGPGGTWCAAALVWTDVFSIRPGASVAITSAAATGPVIPGGSGTLNYTVARRHPTAVNTAGRTPHYYISKTGTQTCYPEVQYSRLLSSDGADNVTCYPAGTTGLTNPCNWGGLTCSSSATGVCTPRFTTTPQTGQYLAVAKC